MKIYTRTGDRGTTALFGGARVPKNHPRLHAYGTVDETNASIGLARAYLEAEPGCAPLGETLRRIQAELFVLGADLATPQEAKARVPRIEAAHVEQLEQDIDRYEAELPSLKHFILPGGTPAASALHVARTVCRRAERRTVEAAASEPLNEHAPVYLNRLSDLLFVAARWVNRQAGLQEAEWNPQLR